jgi:hypothetical protein
MAKPPTLPPFARVACTGGSRGCVASGQPVAHTIATDGPVCERGRLAAIRQVMVDAAHATERPGVATWARDDSGGRDPAGDDYGSGKSRSPGLQASLNRDTRLYRTI